MIACVRDDEPGMNPRRPGIPGVGEIYNAR
jgi:hypothetical protein